jgi:hypothetical protein
LLATLASIESAVDEAESQDFLIPATRPNEDRGRKPFPAGQCTRRRVLNPPERVTRYSPNARRPTPGGNGKTYDNGIVRPRRVRVVVRLKMVVVGSKVDPSRSLSVQVVRKMG